MAVISLSSAVRRYGISRTTLWKLRKDHLLTAPWLTPDGQLETHPPGKMTLEQALEALVRPQIRI
ncbi:hypothetical protein [Synechococcus sp. CBW1107]|uniref:hypothetical protein n=1 Tax=Synechococcus sp. CBW1107 TaxID=2789857 RepID=UPI002AD2824B|nr:hypothetical protein [Synechococcus sp. CBW1107]CAK6692525.1 hypothetical protein ICNINCKA_01230 [Synechococcus sp. CBW1107]